MCATLFLAPAPAYASEQSGDEVKIVAGDEVFDPGEIKPQKTACTGKDSNQSVKYKADLNYAADGSGLVPGVVYMRCGNDGWGLRHIDLEHGDGTTGVKSDHAWRNIVQKHMPGAGWEEFMVFSYEAILSAPSYSSYAEKNDTYRYTAPIKVIVNGKAKRTYHPLVVVSADDYNVITAYPRK